MTVGLNFCFLLLPNMR
jgi:hypothetical protein